MFMLFISALAVVDISHAVEGSRDQIQQGDERNREFVQPG